MMNTKLIEKFLAAIGYRRVKKSIFRFEGGTMDCEHLLAVEIHGKNDTYLTAEFGLRNSDAEAFAINALRRYGDPVFEAWNAGASGCVTWFSVGELLCWYPGAALWQRQSSDEELAVGFSEAIEARVVPITKQVTSTAALLDLLLSNTSPYEWMKSNGALRAAEIVFLACRQGTSSADLTALLQPYFREIEIGLGARRRAAPAEYIDAVITDAIHRVIH